MAHGVSGPFEVLLDSEMPPRHTCIIRRVCRDGANRLMIDKELLAGLAPYCRSRINRLGDYTLNLDCVVEPLSANIEIL